MGWWDNVKESLSQGKTGSTGLAMSNQEGLGIGGAGHLIIEEFYQDPKQAPSYSVNPSGTYTTPKGVSHVMVRAMGGGGGGAGTMGRTSSAGFSQLQSLPKEPLDILKRIDLIRAEQKDERK